MKGKITISNVLPWNLQSRTDQLLQDKQENTTNPDRKEGKEEIEGNLHWEKQKEYQTTLNMNGI